VMLQGLREAAQRGGMQAGMGTGHGQCSFCVLGGRPAR
jgi:hypothetical protein